MSLLLLFQGIAGISGTIAATEGADTLAASGTVKVTGTIAVTEGADVLAATGSIVAQDVFSVFAPMRNTMVTASGTMRNTMVTATGSF